MPFSAVDALIASVGQQMTQFFLTERLIYRLTVAGDTHLMRIRPENMLARAGVHKGYVQYALSNRTPLSAMLSIAGVCKSALPAQLIAPEYCWSVKMYRIFGRSNAKLF